MAVLSGIKLAISVLTLIGSISSALGAGFITLCYLILPIRRHFRHSLILNLAIADLLNGLNNATSGLYILSNGHHPNEAGCTANGLIGQITVQATDCSILAIAIVTLYALTRRTQISETMPRSTTAIICVCTWILPCITGFTTLGLDKYGPASGNWCWIVAEPSFLRYVMTHAWRFLFIFTEIVIYTYLHFYIRKKFGELLDASRSGNSANGTQRGGGDIANEDVEVNRGRQENIDDERDGPFEMSGKPRGGSETGYSVSVSTENTIASKPPKRTRNFNPFSHYRRPSVERNGAEKNVNHRTSRVRKILLLNAYPAAYIILWIPGIINRLVEASGGSSRVLQVLQASTQFVGLANAITYGWNERVGQQLRDYFSDKFGSDRRQMREATIERESQFKAKMQANRERLGDMRDGIDENENVVYSDRQQEWSRLNSPTVSKGPGIPR